MSGTGMKMKSFSLSLGSKKATTPSGPKKEVDKLKKAQEDEEETAKVLNEFVQTFEQSTTASKAKTFVKAASGDASSDISAGILYQNDRMQVLEESTIGSSSSPGPFRPREMEKPILAKKNKDKKSNLEIFKEELKMIQQQREDKTRVKLPELMKVQLQIPIPIPMVIKEGSMRVISQQILKLDPPKSGGSFDTGDPNTTNIYLGNIHPKMNEQQLMDMFGIFGPLASVKVMWPRTEEERARNRNCGFVAFMCRSDGERAIRYLNGKDVMGYEMRLGWGKAVPIPPYPVFIPPKMLDLVKPPPPSGLPFNAQPTKDDEAILKEMAITVETLKNPQLRHRLMRSRVKVVIPTDRVVLCQIHRMIEFVVNEGPMFEAMIMSRELDNPQYQFLFDNQSPAHVYYRWKLFSILQGEDPDNWSTQEFRMFSDGPLWVPPPVNIFLKGMPDHMLEGISPPRKQEKAPEPKREPRGFKETKEPKKGTLTEEERETLEELVRNMTPERTRIANTMMFCVDHSDCWEEVVDCIKESLLLDETPLYKKLARLYLVSDILHNCVVKVANASLYRTGFQSRLEQIAEGLHSAFILIDGRLKAEHFKQKVMSLLRVWDDWAIYSHEYIASLQNTFLGLTKISLTDATTTDDEDIDGEPIDDEDMDGIVIAERKSLPVNPVTAPQLKFKPSKWEAVDPDLVEAQAMTTSKWDSLLIDQPIPSSSTEEEEKQEFPLSPTSLPNREKEDKGSFKMVIKPKDLSSIKRETSELIAELDANKRAILREVEVKVLRYQDDIESGRKPKFSNISMEEQVEEFRKKLIEEQIKLLDASGLRTSKGKGSSRQSDGSPSSNRKRRGDSSSRSTSPSPTPSQSSTTSTKDRDKFREKERQRDKDSERSKESRAEHRDKDRDKEAKDKERDRDKHRDLNQDNKDRDKVKRKRSRSRTPTRRTSRPSEQALSTSSSSSNRRSSPTRKRDRSRSPIRSLSSSSVSSSSRGEHRVNNRDGKTDRLPSDHRTPDSSSSSRRRDR